MKPGFLPTLLEAALNNLGLNMPEYHRTSYAPMDDDRPCFKGHFYSNHVTIKSNRVTLKSNRITLESNLVTF